MLETLNRKNLICVFAALFLISLANSASLAQCGVYFKRTKTWAFPVSRIHLNGAVDMTGDGLPDLLLSEDPLNGGSWTRARIYIVPNLGNGNFGAPATTLVPAAGETFNYRYFPLKANNDNRTDLVVYLGDTGAPSTLRIYMNNGDGTFTPGAPVTLSQYGEFAEINNDGIVDYVSSENGFGTPFRYQLGNGVGTFGSPVTISDHGGGAGDFNGDGKTDFIDSNHLHLNNGDLTWGTIDISAVMAGITIWAYADLNVDGKLDILISNTAGSTGFGILTSTGTGFTRTDHTISVDPSWIGYPWVGQWAGNAAPDIVFQPRYVAKKVVLTNDGTGNFTQEIYNGRIDITNWSESVYADFDNDGKVDRIQATSYISNSRLMLRDVTSFTFMKQVCDQPGETRIVDYDRTDRTDWSFWNPVTGDWSRRTNAYQEGPQTSEETVNWGLGSHGDIPTPGDFDGDGVTDRAVYRNSTGVWYIRKSSDTSWFVLPFGLPGDKPVAGDFDGDTITDIAVFRPSDGNWYFWYMGTQQFSAVHFGADGDKPLHADFDGDFKVDVAVYRPSTGVWYYLKSTNGEFVATQWGISTDIPLPADYDGDGKADLTVYRDSGHVSYILRSYTGSVSYYWYGLTGDVFQVGDYDGDYVSELAVYRPSNRSWWMANIPVWGLFVYGADGVVPTSSLVRVE
jgi:hypothetical protein